MIFPQSLHLGTMQKPLLAFYLLVAAAWSDGEIQPAEALILGQYLLRLKLDEAERRRLTEYLSQRPAADVSHVWIERVQEARCVPRECNELIEALRRVVAADGRIEEREQEILDELKRALAENEAVPLLGRFKQWLGKVTGNHDGVATNHP